MLLLLIVLVIEPNSLCLISYNSYKQINLDFSCGAPSLHWRFPGGEYSGVTYIDHIDTTTVKAHESLPYGDNKHEQMKVLYKLGTPWKNSSWRKTQLITIYD